MMTPKVKPTEREREQHGLGHSLPTGLNWGGEVGRWDGIAAGNQKINHHG
jgi:hypothetical protein